MEEGEKNVQWGSVIAGLVYFGVGLYQYRIWVWVCETQGRLSELTLVSSVIFFWSTGMPNCTELANLELKLGVNSNDTHMLTTAVYQAKHSALNPL